MRGLALVLTALWIAAAPASAHPRCFGAAARDPEVPCANPAQDRTVTPGPDAALLQPLAPCTIVQRRAPEVCAFGPRRHTPTVALIGDSHAQHWTAALTAYGRAAGWRGVTLYRSRCPFSFARKVDHPCRFWVDRDVRYLSQHPAIHTVFVSSDVRSAVDATPALGRETKIAGYIAAWRALPATVTEIYVLRDPPNVTLRTRGCVKRVLRHGGTPGLACANPRADVLLEDPAVAAALRLASPRVRIVDLSPFMCNADSCFPVVGGVLVTKDIGHLTRTFSATLGPYVQRAVTRLRTAYALR